MTKEYQSEAIKLHFKMAHHFNTALSEYSRQWVELHAFKFPFHNTSVAW
jgi:hypothetical protein